MNKSGLLSASLGALVLSPTLALAYPALSTFNFFGGVGAARIDTPNGTSNSSNKPLAYQVGMGLDYAIASQFTWGMNISYQTWGKGDFAGSSSTTFEAKERSINIDGTLKYYTANNLVFSTHLGEAKTMATSDIGSTTQWNPLIGVALGYDFTPKWQSTVEFSRLLAKDSNSLKANSVILTLTYRLSIGTAVS